MLVLYCLDCQTWTNKEISMLMIIHFILKLYLDFLDPSYHCVFNSEILDYNYYTATQFTANWCMVYESAKQRTQWSIICTKIKTLCVYSQDSLMCPTWISMENFLRHAVQEFDETLYNKIETFSWVNIPIKQYNGYHCITLHTNGNIYPSQSTISFSTALQ